MSEDDPEAGGWSLRQDKMNGSWHLYLGDEHFAEYPDKEAAEHALFVYTHWSGE